MQKRSTPDRAARLFPHRCSFWLIAPLVLLLQQVSASDPISVEYDPMHPGHYKPFRCLRVDTDIRGQWGGLKNGCGFDVEAYWYSAKGSASSWTIRANVVYPLFEETEPTVFGCRPNEHLDRTLRLCRGTLSSPKSADSKVDADRLAQDLGLAPAPAKDTSDDAARLARQLGTGVPSQNTNTGAQEDSARLAQQLGVAPISGTSGSDDANTLQADLQAWEVQEQLKREQAERLARIEAERRRIVAAENARLDAIRQAEERERQAIAAAEAEMYEDEQESNGWGSMFGAIGAEMIRQKLGVSPGYGGVTGRTPRTAGAGGYETSTDPCASPEVTRIYAECASITIPAGSGLCNYYREVVNCSSRLEAASRACPAYAAEVRRTRADAESGVAQTCVARQAPAPSGQGVTGGQWSENATEDAGCPACGNSNRRSLK